MREICVSNRSRQSGMLPVTCVSSTMVLAKPRYTCGWTGCDRPVMWNKLLQDDMMVHSESCGTQFDKMLRETGILNMSKPDAAVTSRSWFDSSILCMSAEDRIFWIFLNFRFQDGCAEMTMESLEIQWCAQKGHASLCWHICVTEKDRICFTDWTCGDKMVYRLNKGMSKVARNCLMWYWHFLWHGKFEDGSSKFRPNVKILAKR